MTGNPTKFQWHVLIDIVLGISTVVFGACCLPTYTQLIPIPLWILIITLVILLVSFIYLGIRNHQLRDNYVYYTRVEAADSQTHTLKSDNIFQVRGGELVCITHDGLIDVIAFGTITVDPIHKFCTIKIKSVMPDRQEIYNRIFQNDVSTLKKTFISTCIPASEYKESKEI